MRGGEGEAARARAALPATADRARHLERETSGRRGAGVGAGGGTAEVCCEAPVAVVGAWAGVTAGSSLCFPFFQREEARGRMAEGLGGLRSSDTDRRRSVCVGRQRQSRM